MRRDRIVPRAIKGKHFKRIRGWRNIAKKHCNGGTGSWVCKAATESYKMVQVHAWKKGVGVSWAKEG